MQLNAGPLGETAGFGAMMSAIDLQFGTPEHGWLAVELTAGGASRKLHVSDVPADSIEMLINSIASWYDGVPETSVTWFLEPDREEWTIRREGDLFQITVKSIIVNSSRTVEKEVLSLEGPPSDFCKPIWRALRKLEADSAWSSPSPDLVWSWPFPSSAFAELTRRVQSAG